MYFDAGDTKRKMAGGEEGCWYPVVLDSHMLLWSPFQARPNNQVSWAVATHWVTFDAHLPLFFRWHKGSMNM